MNAPIPSASKFIDIILTIGIPAIVLALIYIGKKLQILSDLRIAIEKIKNNIKVISDYLITNHSTFDPTELRAYSPLRLTEAGEAFIQKIGFNNVFEKNKTDFFSFIDEENPKLKYDVEAAAIKSIRVFYEEKEFISFLKVFFYDNPNRNLENTAPTLGVYIRDKYLSEHPEITQ
ncbi:MAG: hypothetical protein AAB539_03645 [Patescibacteria group bacterium]